MNMMTDVPKPTAAPDAQQIDTYDARDLIKDGTQASIVLDGQIYYLPSSSRSQHNTSLQ